jgi:hypothetical protein
VKKFHREAGTATRCARALQREGGGTMAII